MAWSSKTAISGSTGVANSWTDVSGLITLTPGELGHIQIDGNINSTAVTDNLQVRVLTTVESTAGGYDTSPVFAMSYAPASTAVESFTFSMSGYYGFKLQAQASGATDTYDVTGDYRLDGVSL